MKYTIDRKKQYIVFTLHEEKLDASIAPNLKSEFLAQQAKSIQNMIINLSEVKYTDSSGLSALLVGNRIFKEQKGSFILIGITNYTMKLIEISQLHTILHIESSLEEAISSISKKKK